MYDYHDQITLLQSQAGLNKVKLNGNHLCTYVSAFKIGAKVFNVKIKIATTIKLGFVRKSYLYYVDIH